MSQLTPMGKYAPNMPVFRYMQYQHFLDWVRTGLYRISNICKWEAPYENYLLKCPLLDRFGKRISRIVLPLYGQCWTTLPESDAMWRIYSRISRGQADDTVDSREIGVRIKTTAERLQKLPSIITGFNLGHIGPVKYTNQTDIDRNLQCLQLKNTIEYWDACDNALFEKRKEFSHEQEFRFVFSCSFNCDPLDMDYCYPDYIEGQITPQELIDEVTFDPRIPIPEFHTQQIELKKMGFPVKKTNRSFLYDFNKHNIKLTEV